MGLYNEFKLFILFKLTLFLPKSGKLHDFNSMKIFIRSIFNIVFSVNNLGLLDIRIIFEINKHVNIIATHLNYNLITIGFDVKEEIRYSLNSYPLVSFYLNIHHHLLC